VHPHILCEHKLLFWIQLIAINRLTALIVSMVVVWFRYWVGFRDVEYAE